MTVMIPKAETRYRITVEGEEIYCRTRDVAERFLNALTGGGSLFIEEVEVRSVLPVVPGDRDYKRRPEIDSSGCYRGLRRVK